LAREPTLALVTAGMASSKLSVGADSGGDFVVAGKAAVDPVSEVAQRAP